MINFEVAGGTPEHRAPPKYIPRSGGDRMSQTCGVRGRSDGASQLTVGGRCPVFSARSVVSALTINFGFALTTVGVWRATIGAVAWSLIGVVPGENSLCVEYAIALRHEYPNPGELMWLRQQGGACRNAFSWSVAPIAD